MHRRPKVAFFAMTAVEFCSEKVQATSPPHPVEVGDIPSLGAAVPDNLLPPWNLWKRKVECASDRVSNDARNEAAPKLSVLKLNFVNQSSWTTLRKRETA